MVDRDLLAAKLAELKDRVTRVRARVPDADAARTPLHDERRRLLSELDALEAQERVELPASSKPFAALRSLSGTAHSEFTDLSTDKYAHVAAAVLDADD